MSRKESLEMLTTIIELTVASVDLRQKIDRLEGENKTLRNKLRTATRTVIRR